DAPWIVRITFDQWGPKAGAELKSKNGRVTVIAAPVPVPEEQRLAGAGFISRAWVTRSQASLDPSNLRRWL
ncbi:MAG: hypothetical protein WAL59_17135, partial [Roseiarcus sp.]